MCNITRPASDRRPVTAQSVRSAQNVRQREMSDKTARYVLHVTVGVRADPLRTKLAGRCEMVLIIKPVAD